MKVVVATFGSRGDVQPYLALTRALLDRGHDARLATHSSFEGLAQRHRVPFVSAGEDPQTLLERAIGPRALGTEPSQLHFLRSTRAVAREVLEQALRALVPASEGANLVVGSALAAPLAASVAEKQGARFVGAYYLPVHPSAELGSLFLPEGPGPRPLRALWARSGHWLTRTAFRALALPGVNALRREVLQLEAMHSLEALDGTPPFALYGFSPALVKRPADWPHGFHVTGAWNVAEPYTPPPELERFLAAGEPPVAVGFGSMKSEDPVALTRLVVEALDRARLRGVLLTGARGLSPDALPPSVVAFESAPHQWLLPRVAAVVHHAGAGVSHGAARAGVPSVPVPYFADQPFWARALHAHEAATAPIRRKELTVERLAAALVEVTSAAALTRGAQRLASEMRLDGGAVSAAERLEERCH